MQVTVTVPDTILREARVHGHSLAEFVEGLIEKGVWAAQGKPDLERAMAQFRAIRAAKEAAKKAAAGHEQAAD